MRTAPTSISRSMAQKHACAIKGPSPPARVNSSDLRAASFRILFRSRQLNGCWRSNALANAGTISSQSSSRNGRTFTSSDTPSSDVSARGGRSSRAWYSFGRGLRYAFPLKYSYLYAALRGSWWNWSIVIGSSITGIHSVAISLCPLSVVSGPLHRLRAAIRFNSCHCIGGLDTMVFPEGSRLLATDNGPLTTDKKDMKVGIVGYASSG